MKKATVKIRRQLWFSLLLTLMATRPTGVRAQTGPTQGRAISNVPNATNAASGANPTRRRRQADAGPPTLGLEQGLLVFDTPDFHLKLVKASQTVATLEPKGGDGFDFTPADQLEKRTGNHFYQLGDVTMRVREGNAGDWQNYSTAADRKPVTALAISGDTLAAADLTASLPGDCPLLVTRSWILDKGKLALEFSLSNKTAQAVEIGSFGIPLIFNNFISGRSLEQAHAICSFSDPAICMDGGYVQVTRLNGHGPAMVVVPRGKTPLEAYEPIMNERDGKASNRIFADRTPRSQTFEGFYEWMPLSKADAESDWKNVTPWNPATSEILAAGATRSFGLEFLLAPEITNIEETLIANDRPVAFGIPGYIAPKDIDARLFLKYSSKIRSVEVEPADAIAVKKNATTEHGWNAYTLRGKTWGRARVTVTYEDGVAQTINYDVIKSEAQVVADLGHFSFTKQWFDDASDPFHREPSVMTYDRAHDRIVTQDARAWVAGLEDEGGAGSWLAAAMKEFGQPEAEEVGKLQRFVDEVVWGGIQYSNGPLKYGVRKSLFYYDTNALPNYYDSSIPYGGWTSWSKRDAERIDRAYNYPHVVAAYWVMYQLARNHEGLVTSNAWDWYLDQAFETAKFLTGRNADGDYNVGYIGMGLMEGDIFLMLLKDLKHEGWTEKVKVIEDAMKARADEWNRAAFPFGSEMAWDSTGQEEVFAWCDYFGFADKAQVTLDSILAYMPSIPSWGYNGNARRYWDFYYGAAPGGRLERQIHHYGSGINAIPLLASYREHPNDYHLLRVGYAGTMAPLSNIDQEGFAAAAFHSSPSLLKWDTYSGDYGPNFFGHAVDTGTYIIDHPEFGWQAFGGNLEIHGKTVKVTSLDSFRKRVYVAPLGLWLTLDSGTFDSVEIDKNTHTVRLGFSEQTAHDPLARLRVSQPAKMAGVGTYHVTPSFLMERDAFNVPLKAHGTTWVELTAAE